MTAKKRVAQTVQGFALPSPQARAKRLAIAKAYAAKRNAAISAVNANATVPQTQAKRDAPAPNPTQTTNPTKTENRANKKQDKQTITDKKNVRKNKQGEPPKKGKQKRKSDSKKSPHILGKLLAIRKLQNGIKNFGSNGENAEARQFLPSSRPPLRSQKRRHGKLRPRSRLPPRRCC